jgi:endoglucanase
MSKQISNILYKLKLVFLVTAFMVSSGGLAFINITKTDAAKSTQSSLNNWWPKEGSSVTGTQSFTANLANWSVDQYEMYWSVDNGSANKMVNSYSGYPHKTADVNVDLWQWQADGSYTLSFIAKQPNGTEITRTSINISTPVDPAAAPTNPTQTSAPTAQTLDSTKPTAPTTAVASSNQPGNIKTKSLVNFFVDPNSQVKKTADGLRSARPTDAALLDKIANNAGSRWFGGWNSNIQSDVNGYVSSAADAIPVLVAYNIPQRDCGSYSAGGAGSGSDYLSWIDGMVAGIGSRDAWVVLEPDAVAGMSCLNSSDQSTRLSLIAQAVAKLKVNPRTKVYIDAGHARWKTPAVMADLLSAANIAAADGFSLNVSNFLTNSENVTYGQAISAKINNKAFVIDTSRNGLGPNAANEWCNPAGRALGNRATDDTGNGLVDAYLWIKAPGESDGQCNGGPSAGTWWLDEALGLASRAAY